MQQPEDHDSDLRLERIVSLLSTRSRTILALRYAGYEWEETAAFFGMSVSALIDSLRLELKQTQIPPGTPLDNDGSLRS
jgi:DNA-directed RNA polymerase specialized sigma24 family protein